METMKCGVSVHRVLELKKIAFLLRVDEYPVRCKRGKCDSWIDCVIELLRENEDYEFVPVEKLIVLRQLGIDQRGFSYACDRLCLDVNNVF